MHVATLTVNVATCMDLIQSMIDCFKLFHGSVNSLRQLYIFIELVWSGKLSLERFGLIIAGFVPVLDNCNARAEERGLSGSQLNVYCLQL